MGNGDRIRIKMVKEEFKKKANPENYCSFSEWAKANKWLIILSPIYLIFGIVAVVLAFMAKLIGITYKDGIIMSAQSLSAFLFLH